MKWIEITEKYPKKEGGYLVYYPTIINKVFSCWFDGKKFCHPFKDGFTHWGDLPEGPKP